MVDHRTQQTSQDLDYYYFVKPPPERNSSNPLGVHVDGKIMPQRDIDDATNGTDTWKELHGVDLYFAEEGALERSYASHQFDGRYVIREQHVDEPYPTSVPIANFTKGTIEGYPWQYTVGNWPAGSRQTGIGDCFAEQFIGISNASELQDSYTKWPDGSEIEYFVDVQDICSRINIRIGQWVGLHHLWQQEIHRNQISMTLNQINHYMPTMYAKSIGI